MTDWKDIAKEKQDKRASRLKESVAVMKDGEGDSDVEDSDEKYLLATGKSTVLHLGLSLP